MTTTATTRPVSWTFQYYLPHISTSTDDLYTVADWIAYDMREDPEELVAGDFAAYMYDLPFIGEDDFHYYPKPCEVPYNDDMAVTEDRFVLEGELKEISLVRKKRWEGLWLERAVSKLLRRIRLKNLVNTYRNV